MIFVLPILVFKSVGKKRRPVFPQTLLAMSATGFDRPTDATVLYKKGSSGLVGQVRATPQKKKVFIEMIHLQVHLQIPCYDFYFL